MNDLAERPRLGPPFKGFQRWIKLSMDDLPLIRPPRRHMLPQFTGGLRELFMLVKKDESRRQKLKNDYKTSSSPMSNSFDRFSPTSDDGDKKKIHGSNKNCLSGSTDPKGDEKNKLKKRDDEGGGDFDMEDEETSPYTDEEGEFAPETSMPLLASRYKYVKVLARGQSALIVKALDTFAKDKPIAIKVLHRIYQPIGSQEADILLELHRADPWLHVPFARLQNQFIYGPHYCLVFEFLSPTPLYTHYEHKNIKGPKSLSHVRNLCVKLLSVLGFLHKQNVIHADLKPENILLKDEDDMSSVMVVDFGNALRNTEEELSLYYSDFELQTLLYRAPEVIFGLKFSLQIDLWSLGCLLAECFTGQPLFLGKTKHDILSKITKLLGPFSKEFSEGECASLYKEFIGKPLFKYERVDNLRKKLNCKDINFLLLLERLLTYWPGSRINPFEAASHSFVAGVNPFLYLTSSESKRYPTVLLDEFTYPHMPKQPENDKENKSFTEGRRSLLAYSFPPAPSEVKFPTPNSPISLPIKQEITESEPTSTVKQPEISRSKANNSIEPQAKANNISIESPFIAPTQNKVDTQNKNECLANPSISGESTAEPSIKKEDEPVLTGLIKPKPVMSSPENKPTSKPEIEKEISQMKSPKETVSEPRSSKSPEPRSSTTPNPTKTPPPVNSEHLKVHTSQTLNAPKNPTSYSAPHIKGSYKQPQKALQHRGNPKNLMDPNYNSKNFTQTLKAMGLRCEDFTISVYSREQAHAILRKQGVEVTNHNPSKQHYGPRHPTRNPKVNPNISPSVSIVRPDVHKQLPHPPPAKKPLPPVASAAGSDDDDDDCVILDPPEGAKPPPPLPRYPQRFQLMGTTVQVNRGAKRPLRGMHRPPAKRFNQRPPQFYFNENFNAPEENTETSVQDTLKRLKNYNISITCRRNSNTKQNRPHMDSDEEMEHDDSHSEEEDEDLAKYLECEINEEKQLEECFEQQPINLDSSASGIDTSLDENMDEEAQINEEKSSSKPQDILTDNKSKSDEETDKEKKEDKPQSPPPDLTNGEENVSSSQCQGENNPEGETCPQPTEQSTTVKNGTEPVENIPDGEKPAATISPHNTNEEMLNTQTEETQPTKEQLAPTFDDDDINEELEKQLLESGNLDKEYDDELGEDCLDL